ncbi:RNA polymerase sigma factor, sigma-70 family [Haloechinothrix alba]|uniref:RNA polymerase sigma factor, sigma-70 family n=1 Tax=Haloechinothrix alba TaxID=664784 RepID=A0A238VW98_9PSEU|nr:sigma-70 family RNA polymerase sigma factor [Haloechinothrix alba]SNR38580.1 RNA polymerase sigma factor, sigma-70 family [Haloechinothrix alba]
MSTVPAEPAGASDAELIASVREGDLSAYGTLYERHVSAANNLARQLARSSTEADDLVADAFAKMLDTLRAGKGPDSAFRAYLLTTLRHSAYDKTRRDRRVDLNEDMSSATGEVGSALTVPFSDTAVAGLERSMAAQAFARLPERWQAVLWHTEIEQQSPAEIAPLLGLTANGVSALAYRAREGLRQAYLQVHLSQTSEDRCRATADRLGAWTRDGLSKRERTQVEAHLDECDSCRALAAELADINGALRAVIAPIVLGGAVLGYLATAGAAKASAAAGAAGTAAATTAAGAASGASGGAGAAGAAAGAPRQFLGVAASATAVAAAVAVGMVAGGDQSIPEAQQPAPQQQEQQQEEGPQPPPPPEEPDSPDAPPAEDPPDGDDPETPDLPPPPAPEPEPAPEPAPAPAQLDAAGPPGGIELTPGGEPTDVPITVRNDGESPSDPATVTLTLPDGVVAESHPNGGSQPMGDSGARSAAPPHAGARTQQQDSADSAIRCPSGTGTVSCGTREGLDPGESVTLLFRLSAGAGAEPGEITGTVDSGDLATVRITIAVRMDPPADGVAVTARPFGHGVSGSGNGRLSHITVTNTGETTERASLHIDGPATVFSWQTPWRMTCTSTAEETRCTTQDALEPDDTVRVWTLVQNRYDPCANDTVTVTGRIGIAEDSDTVTVGWWWPCDVPPNTPPGEPTTPSSPPVPQTPDTQTTPSPTPPTPPSVSTPPSVPPSGSPPDVPPTASTTPATPETSPWQGTPSWPLPPSWSSFPTGPGPVPSRSPDKPSAPGNDSPHPHAPPRAR